jgi:hypothetical protein
LAGRSVRAGQQAAIRGQRRPTWHPTVHNGRAAGRGAQRGVVAGRVSEPSGGGEQRPGDPLRRFAAAEAIALTGSNEYATASTSPGSSPDSRKHQAADSSGSSHAANGTGRLPRLRRLNRSSSAAATTRPSTTSAAAGSWKIALIPGTRMAHRLPCDQRLALMIIDFSGGGPPTAPSCTDICRQDARPDSS